MYDIFNLNNRAGRGTLETPRVDLLINKQRRELDKAKAFYRSNPVFVNSGSWISRVVYLFSSWDMTQGPKVFYRRALDEVNELCLVGDIAGPLTKPEVITDEFCFKYTVPCLVLGSRQTDSLDVLISKWETLAPITVIYRPGTYGGIQLPYSSTNNVDDYMLLGVDLPLLALMFRQFMISQEKLPLEERDSTADFIAKYVLPNMLDSQFDMIITNIVRNVDDYKDVRWNNSVPFNNIDYTDSIDTEIRKLVTSMGTKSMLMNDILLTLPAMTGSFFTIPPNFGIPDTAYTIWYKTIAGINVVGAVAQFIHISGEADSVLNRTSRIMRQVRSDRSWSKLDDKKLGTAMEELFSNVLLDMV